MTPRNLLFLRRTDGDAERLANRKGFDAVPISRSDGKIIEFWSRTEQRRVRIRRAHRVAHDAPLESLLRDLGDHVVQFVHYRSEVVGLVDASDLNKPIARIAWLYPMLELERALLDASRRYNVSEGEQARALGDHAAVAKKRQSKAKREEIDMPLLDYAQFPDLLRASRNLGLLKLTDADIEGLNDIRKRAAHSGDSVVNNRSDCVRIIDALQLARRATSEIGRHRRNRLHRPGT